MRAFIPIATMIAGLCPASVSRAAEIQGQYLEARTCDVYTGPCFANGEMGLAGKEALLAWKVDRGSWNGTDLAGLSVALALKADNSLGEDGVFPMQPGRIKSVILVDEQADDEQQAALVSFVKETASRYTGDVRKIETVPMSLTSNQITSVAEFRAGEVAEIRTRSFGGHDCVCSNELVFYKPSDRRALSPAGLFAHAVVFGRGLKFHLDAERIAERLSGDI